MSRANQRLTRVRAYVGSRRGLGATVGEICAATGLSPRHVDEAVALLASGLRRFALRKSSGAERGGEPVYVAAEWVSGVGVSP